MPLGLFHIALDVRIDVVVVSFRHTHTLYSLLAGSGAFLFAGRILLSKNVLSIMSVHRSCLVLSKHKEIVGKQFICHLA